MILLSVVVGIVALYAALELWVVAVLLGAAQLGSLWMRRASLRARKRRQLSAQAKSLLEERDNARAQFKSLHAVRAPTRSEALALCAQSATELLHAMHSRRVSVETVMRAHIARAIAATEKLNCNAQEPFEEALDEAIAVDARLADRAYVPRPLEGLPVSIKDCLDQRGWHSTCGLASKCVDRVDRDGLVVALLREQGAIPFVRTNVPQALMAPETANYVFGESCNPFSLLHTPGGSSGGEAAIVAALASPLGIGSDIGGSLRGPAHFTGICTLKPTPGRVTRLGSTVPRHGTYGLQPHIVPTTGPMARCVDDLVLPLRHCWWTERCFELDPTCVPLPFNEAAFRATTPYKVGYFETDGLVSAAPAVRRAVREAAAALASLPHVTVVQFDAPRFDDAVYLFYALLSAEGKFEGFENALDGEPLHSVYGDLATLAKLPTILRGGISALLGVLGEKRLARLVNETNQKSAAELWKLVTKQRQLISCWLEQMQEHKVDVLICPPCAQPAFLLGQSRDVTPMACSYNFVFNLLHFPSGVVPVTRVRADEATSEAYSALEVNHRDRIARLLAKGQVGSAGLPCGVQVVGLPNRDEHVLRVMRELESALNKARGAPFDVAELARSF
jgi:fatty acid amide hydrolase